MKHTLALTIMLLLGSSACAAPTPSPTPVPPSATVTATAPPTATETPAPPPERSTHLVELIESVNTSRLYADVATLSSINSRHVNSATIADAAAYIYMQFMEAGGRLEVSNDEFPLTWNGVATTQRNVIAVLPGSDPQAGVVLVGAHYDSRTADINDAASRAPGADDNATGTAAVIELARLLAEETPRATVVFAAFSAEEVGKVGSTHFLETWSVSGDGGGSETRPYYRAVIALDIVGNAAGPAGEGSIRAFAAPPPETPSQALARGVALLGEGYLSGWDVVVQPAVDRPHRYSDHVPFSEAGFAAMRLIEPIEELSRQHSPLDTADYVSATYLRNAAATALVGIYSAAWGLDAPGAPYYTDVGIGWDAVDGAAGYVVAVRGVDELEYRNVYRVSGETLLRWADMGDELPGDLFSVAAVSADGLVGMFSAEYTLLPPE